MTDYAALSNAALNEAAALRIGWHRKLKTSERYFDADGNLASFSFNPQRSIDDAARFGAAFQLKHGCYFRVWYTGAEWVCNINTNFENWGAGAIKYQHASEARARTVAVLQAWEAMGAG